MPQDLQLLIGQVAFAAFGISKPAISLSMLFNELAQWLEFGGRVSLPIVATWRSAPHPACDVPLSLCAARILQ